MNSSAKNTVFPYVLCILMGLSMGLFLMWLWQNSLSKPSTSDSTPESENKPLYWVAPMDPNFRRDKPGKSPMGMDLVPVYENDSSNDDDVGTVSISPSIVNNLGVRTAQVTRGRLQLTVNTVGYVQYDEDRLIHIHPRVEGWIEKLYVKSTGDPVKKDEPLYALYAPTLVNAQEELLLALKRNNPALISAASERLSALQVPKADIQRLRRTGKVSQTITVTAPQSGVLDNLNAREGMFVKPGMEMMSIGQLQHVWVIGEVFERQAASVRVGDPVIMQLDYLPGRQWQGEVDYIYPSLNTRTRTTQVRVHFDNHDTFLKPGMFTQMTISTQPGDESLLIPREALIRTGAQTRVVLAKGQGRFKSIAVKTGRINEKQAEILSGLDEGERIVTSAQFMIDSESSKTSDFNRMNHKIDDTPVQNATVDGVIHKIDQQQRILNISRGPIEKWDRPAATLDFSAATDIDLSKLSVDQTIRFTFEVDNGKFNIININQFSPSQEHNHD